MGLLPPRQLLMNFNCRWVYRNAASILDPAAVDTGIGSRNGSVNSLSSRIPQSYEPRLRYNHMGILSHLPNGSIAAAWQVPLAASHQTLVGIVDCKHRVGGGSAAAGHLWSRLLTVPVCPGGARQPRGGMRGRPTRASTGRSRMMWG